MARQPFLDALLCRRGLQAARSNAEGLPEKHSKTFALKGSGTKAKAAASQVRQGAVQAEENATAATSELLVPRPRRSIAEHRRASQSLSNVAAVFKGSLPMAPGLEQAARATSEPQP